MLRIAALAALKHTRNSINYSVCKASENNLFDMNEDKCHNIAINNSYKHRYVTSSYTDDQTITFPVQPSISFQSLCSHSNPLRCDFANFGPHHHLQNCDSFFLHQKKSVSFWNLRKCSRRLEQGFYFPSASIDSAW